MAEGYESTPLDREGYGIVAEPRRLIFAVFDWVRYLLVWEGLSAYWIVDAALTLSKEAFFFSWALPKQKGRGVDAVIFS